MRSRPKDRLPLLREEETLHNLLVRIHFIIVMIWWTGFAPWEFEFPFPGSLTSTFHAPAPREHVQIVKSAYPDRPMQTTSFVRWSK